MRADERVDTDALSDADTAEELATTLEEGTALEPTLVRVDTDAILETVDADATLEIVDTDALAEDKRVETELATLETSESEVSKELLGSWASAESARRRAHKAESLVLSRRAMASTAFSAAMASSVCGENSGHRWIYRTCEWPWLDDAGRPKPWSLGRGVPWGSLGSLAVHHACRRYSSNQVTDHVVT